MPRAKKPQATTALVPTSGPPDAVIVRDLRLHHALFKGSLPTLVCQEGAGKINLVWEDRNAVDTGATYLIADAATYEILGMVRKGRHYLKPHARVALGMRLLLIAMGTV